MEQADLEKYWKKVIAGRPVEARAIHPVTVVTAPWVRMKCQFGCAGYGRRYGCPPDSPGPDETRKVLDCYERAVLFHIEAAKKEGENRRKLLNSFFEDLVDLEGDMFKDGYYRAFAFLAGPCHLCKECAKLKGDPCLFGSKARPSLEACGIDVYQTARNNGFFIQPLREKSDTQNDYCLMLVD